MPIHPESEGLFITRRGAIERLLTIQREVEASIEVMERVTWTKPNQEKARAQIVALYSLRDETAKTIATLKEFLSKLEASNDSPKHPKRSTPRPGVRAGVSARSSKGTKRSGG